MITSLRGLLRRKFVQDTITLQLSKIGVTVLGLAAWVYVPVRLGAHEYGLFALAQSFLGIWQTLDLTGLNVGIPILLATAVGAKDEREIKNLMGVYVQISTLWTLLTLAVMLLFGAALATALYRETAPLTVQTALRYTLAAGLETVGNPQIGLLAGALALTLLFDPLYTLLLAAFRSRRNMRQVAVLQNANQLVLTVCLVAAAFFNPTAEGQVIGRIVYAIGTLALIAWVYQQTRADGKVTFPSIPAVLRHALRVSFRPYWRYGLSSALDKNIGNLYTQIPLQLVGIMAGPAAASYIQLGLRGILKTSFFTSAVYENIQAVVPQSIGQRDYARLWANFLRVLVVLTAAGIGFYALVILLAPLLLVPIFGTEWLPILPLLPALCIFGLTTTIGGVFGPLYRALNLMRAALLSKVATLVIMIPVGWWLVQQAGALGGVWMINGLYIISVALTIGFTLPVLRRQARQSHQA
jgi:O-antigen/teichoic acid export membrane protein